MKPVNSDSELADLLQRFEQQGGVLDYVSFEDDGESPGEQAHRAAAIAGIEAIDRRLEQWAIRHASDEYPIEKFFRLRWEEAKLKGQRVSLSAFWGTDDVVPKPFGDRSWLLPEKDGYKTVFFHPPYGLRGTSHENELLFAGINRIVLGDKPEFVEIFSWSTDWSNYFDAGHDWWGAFLDNQSTWFETVRRDRGFVDGLTFDPR